MARKQSDSGMTDNEWVGRINEIRQMVADVLDAPEGAADVDWYIEQFALHSDEEAVARREFERQYGIAS